MNKTKADHATSFDPPRSFRLAAQATDAYRRIFAASAAAPLLSRPKPVRYSGFDMILEVSSVQSECEDVVSITLTAPDGEALPAWIPGAHLDVYLPSGKQRQYSLCGDPGDLSCYRIAVRRIADGNGGSREIHHDVVPGMQLNVRGPRNAFPLVEAPSYLFIAGGIGITPILPMIRRCHERGIPWSLDYLGRTRATMPFLAEIAGFTSGQVTIRPDDEFGIPDIASMVSASTPGAAVYICGPTPLMSSAREVMVAVNPTGSLHSERFSPLPVVDGNEFTVHLAKTGVTVDVGTKESTLAAVRRVLPGVAYSCQQGFCGTCKVHVLSGNVDHRDTLLTDTERSDFMLTCRSRATGGSLVLDL
ncbi:PDR/VanB family oxidoreductase [Rhodococcus sp. ARC_M6]|uniref:PDR/VanB family oxidoreductase n=1 Tax=Rhodococcus sp. ARC_M6 TaxID=2928852 RepID=UPI001FB3F4A4|nr:PDR/VanB family oxidoreductase [Rhodococcus sp. ARC_M6]MCJ0904977.1 PDR/VanB family oxidoreductase [Rhodococcus sp. ARC_M6]